ncbi:MAG: hypothetical protein NTW80_08455 [Deltaproteobacteria bacterium]|nr:hypothetical protein [Deltaproteobacteria bacterium]
MKNKRCLIIGLALAGVLLLAGSGLAQNRGGGGGRGPAGQGNQVCTGGPGGTCAVTPAPNANTQNCPGYGAGQSQKRQGMKGPRGGRMNQPNTPANPPATTQ